MPYRRLPNTDNARIRALKTAVEKCSSTDFQELAVEMKTLQEAKNVLSRFERLYDQYQQAFDIQVKANILFQQKAKNARMYLSHFVQVLYMCIIRSEIKAEHLKLYGLENQHMLVPDFSSNELLLEWGEKIIAGEESRIQKGGVPIFNPTIAKVKVMFSLFKEGYQTQKIHQKATLRLQNQVTEAREIVDSIIFDIWEQVEKTNKDLPLSERLERNREYGVVYYYRKGETVEE
ncbi:hypothetical protein [Anaerorudis cellulosivorans]|uniref:hypothetical protein n=1 Tax=Anaerorudis cellulosivorans TaxID=3397862 RepID=UPI0022212A52|nr:hypothetical protein [Seramator thermalis]MCW1735595.1 hypothetical protein [Seramator thermalis]